MKESANKRGRIPSKLAKERAELAVNRLKSRMNALDAEMEIKPPFLFFLDLIPSVKVIFNAHFLEQSESTHRT